MEITWDTYRHSFGPGLTIYIKVVEGITHSLGIEPRMSTAFHPATNSQTERVNQTIKAFLRAFVNLEMSDLVARLPIAECAYKNWGSTATGYSPF
jgi:hypothetical protein